MVVANDTIGVRLTEEEWLNVLHAMWYTADPDKVDMDAEARRQIDSLATDVENQV